MSTLTLLVKLVTPAVRRYIYNSGSGQDLGYILKLSGPQQSLS